MDTYEDLQQATLHELPRPECLDLLGLSRVGRVVYADDHGPVALPVNFRMSRDRIIFRVSPGSDMCRRLEDADVAFEVDRIDDFHYTGWSVLVRGRSSYVDPENLALARSEVPVPWARGHRPVYVQIEPTEITGRRLVDD